MRIEGSPSEGGRVLGRPSWLVASCSSLAEPDAAVLVVCSTCCSWLQYLDPAAALLEAGDIASVVYFFVLGEQACITKKLSNLGFVIQVDVHTLM